jgi:SAM-dependent methyltransferase
MEKDEYRKHFEMEEDFWWFRGRREVILSILGSFKILDGKLNILDVGCGTGFNLKVFQTYGFSFGCDLSHNAIYFCQKRGLKNVAYADAGKLPYKDESFDLVTLLDVLYHKNVQNDMKVLLEIQRVLKKGGYLLITDSAFNFLRSSHDVVFHTRERYNRKILKERLEKANLSIKKMSYFNFFLFLAVLTIRTIEKGRFMGREKIESNLKPVNKKINALLLNILKFEAFLIEHVNFPFGSSILCLAKK